MTSRKPPQSSRPAEACGNTSSSSRFLSRFFSLPTHYSNNDGQLNNEDNDDCVDFEDNIISDEVKQFSSNSVRTHDRNNASIVEEENDRNYSLNAAAGTSSIKQLGIGSNSSKFYDLSAESFSSTPDMESPSIYDVCNTIDESMMSLYTDILTEESSHNNDNAVPPITAFRSRISHAINNENIQYEYDWILDGDPPQHPIKETDTAASRRRRLFGDDKLDLMLGMLEIENQEFVSCDEESLDDGSVMDNNGEKCNNNEGGEEVGDIANFADFSKLELTRSLENEEEEFGSFTAAQTESDTDCIQKCESGLPYEPPEAIECLVNDITAQLDTHIEECLDMSTDKHSVGTNYISDCENDSSASEHLLKQMNQSETALHGGQKNQHAVQQQSALMSAILLESLPVPMATETFGGGDDALIASLTRRVQKQHQASVAAMKSGASSEQDDDMLSSQIDQENDLLEQALSDIIHPGYFEETENDINDEHYFDSIVLEEMLTVPWPFHEITDINEPLFGDGVFDSSDSDDSDDNGFDTLNFDTYISNRLTQLHQASAQVVKCLHKRASEREDSINKGIQSVFAAEIDIESALLITKSSREFLHRAINGYPVSDGEEHEHYHNAVKGSLDVLEYSDSRDRLGLLLVTVDRITSIREEEENWWRELSDERITAENIPFLVEGLRKLKQLTVLEEALTHLECMKEMNERINKLPGVLLSLVEETLAGLFDRILSSDETSHDRFGELYFKEYQTLLQSWIACIELRDGEHSKAKDRCSAVSTEWSGCLLDILCFAVKKAVAYAMIDSFSTSENETASDRDLDLIKEIRGKLKQIRFRSKDESELESLSQKLLLMRVGGIVRVGGTFNCTALSLTFFHLSSRLVELLSSYEVACQWHEAMLANACGVNESEYFADGECDQGETVPSCSGDVVLAPPATISMVSSNQDSLSTSSYDSSEEDEAEVRTKPVPSRIAFEENKISSLVWSRAILQSVGCVRQALWKYCEESLIHLVESFSSDSMDLGFQSGHGVDSATSSLHLTYDVFQQFAAFSEHFYGSTADEALCDTLKNNLWKLYRTHLRSVHIEAMKSTGSLLRQESWQLSPINISRSAHVADSTDDPEVAALYEAVKELLLTASPNNLKSTCTFDVTTRSLKRGYKYCASFANFLRNKPDSSKAEQGDEADKANDYFGVCSKEFCSTLSSLIERSPCGELTLTLLSTSSADGLLKWVTHLLAIGNDLPLVAVDATNAIVTLFDLYFLTVFRICASSRTNEDVVIGLGRGSSAQSISSSLMSVTMEADACAPLPSEVEGFAGLQRFVQNSRTRLDRMVNLDKFQPADQLSIGSPVKQHETNALRLEKESAAAFSCLIMAIVVDIASSLRKDLDVPTDEDDAEEMLTSYAQEVISMAPVFVKQSCYLSATRALSGKELIFKIVCCGKAWTDNVFKEYSNDYVDDLCERASLLWGHIASRGRLPPPAQRLMWDHLVRSSFMLLLEGFSKVTTCSTEGRSLMSMDLATLSSGLVSDSIKERLDTSFPIVCVPPPQSRREDSMRYVDTWIKVFFFPEEDAMDWIKQNRDQYHLDHSISLIAAKIPPKKKQIIASKTKAVINIYN